jgi:hypothetical protein
MKLPKLPIWAWALLVLYAVGVWFARELGAKWSDALLFPVLRFFRKDSAPIKGLMPGTNYAAMQDARTFQQSARQRSYEDRYKTYLATTSSAAPLTYDAWLSVELGETQPEGTQLQTL